MKFSGIAGILTPLFAFTFIGLAIFSSPTFSWVNNALSDLGVVPGVTSQLFNFGLFVSGLFSVVFAIGLYELLKKNVLGKISSVVFLLASFSLMGIGIANEDIRPFHFVFSVAFFVFVPVSLLVVSAYFFWAHQKRIAIFTFLISVLAVAPWMLFSLYPYVQGVAIPEVLSALAGAVWAVFVGWKMLREASQPKSS